VFEAEMALARAQMKAAATPQYTPPPAPPRAPSTHEPQMMPNADPFAQPLPFEQGAKSQSKNKLAGKSTKAARTESSSKASATATNGKSQPTQKSGKVQLAGATEPVEQPGPPEGPPPGWPDARSFIPQSPCDPACACIPTNDPILKHTRIYNGNDGEFTAALANYVFFQDDARRGGWQAYLQRSDDFIRFCCRLHLHEMLSARGGAGETRVVWRWPTDR
jgi:hypothetical protein